MGSPYGSNVVFSSHSIGTKSSLDSWSVFLQNGVTVFGSGSHDLISSEGITRVGLLRAFFPGRPRGEFFVILWSTGLLAVWEGPTFSCLRFWQGLCVYPSRQRRSGSWPFFFWPCCLSPSPGGLVCFGSLAVIHFTWAFHVLVLHAWWLTSCTSGSRTSRKGLLAYCQGASDSRPHPSPGREIEDSVFDIAVRMLLQATSLPSCMEASLAPGQGLSVSAFKGCNSVLKAFSFCSAGTSRSPELLRCPRNFLWS